MSSTRDLRRRTLDGATQGSESPAEWSQKIKSLQQQVDDDLMQEQARLEAEIARSRLERANRRSVLTGNARIDQAAASYLSRLPDDKGPTGTREQHQADTFERLTSTSTPASNTSTLPNERASTPPKAISLAEFMGGKATGPRLNRHAPQADFRELAADTEARMRGGSVPLLQKVTTRSPVALPGLTDERSTSKDSITSEKDKERSHTPDPVISKKTTERDRETNKPETTRASTFSTPSQITPKEPTFSKAEGAIDSPRRATFNATQTSTPSPRNITPTNDDRKPTSANSRPISSPPSQATSPVAARWLAATNPATATSPPKTSPSPPNSQPRVNMLARPVQPSVAAAQQFIPPTNPSPAFLRATSEKEERPSITRLKGRGFVERQVKASAVLSATQEEAPKLQRPGSSEKKLTVLERWPMENSGKSNAAPNTPLRDNIPKREFTRSLTMEAPRSAPANATSLQSSQIGRVRNPDHNQTPMRLPGMEKANSFPAKDPLSRASSQPQDSAPYSDKEATPRRLPGLATGSTTPSALKKTPSLPQLRDSSRRRSVHFDDPDEGETGTPLPDKTSFDGNQTDVYNSKKLTHLTKDRAKKPRKVAATRPSANEDKDAQVREENLPVIQKMRDISPGITKSSSRSTSVSPPPGMKSIQDIKEQLLGKGSATSSSTSLVTSDSPKPTGNKKPIKAPPPIIPVKPAALRRNSQPTPTESTAPALSTQPPTGKVGSIVGGYSKPSNGSAGVNGNGSMQPSTQPVSANQNGASNQGKPISGQRQSRSEEDDPEDHSSVLEVQDATSAKPTDNPPIIVPPVLNPPTVPMPQPRPRPLSYHAERRRSITDRYSSIMLPALKEEKTPIATPEGSLRANSSATATHPSVHALHESLAAITPSDRQASEERGDSQDQLPALSTGFQEDKLEANSPSKHSPVSPLDRLVTIPFEDQPVPSFSLSRLLASVPATPKFAPGSVISVETFSVSGSSAIAIKDNMHIFYDAEAIAIVYRGKNKTTGLVSTTVWGWIGSNCEHTEKEETKLGEIATRFNTTLVKIKQGKEPFECVQLLGGTIVVRHGSRAHWSLENTALYCVRSHGSNLVVIEEVELASRNVCSAFSYCLAILDTLFVWHGKGSLPLEREAAESYSKLLARDAVETATLEEGAEDDMFWVMFDEGSYANADYWRFRPQTQLTPRLWEISKGEIQSLLPFCALDFVEDKVLMYDGVFELFVLVGEQARGRRDEIRLAIAAAESVAAASALTRSFPPPVHILIFPTQIPIDLRASFRLMDQYEMNSAEPPAHINLLTLAQAHAQLSQREWKLRDLKDHLFLPLGISPSTHPRMSL
ncbi:hypothetical protein CPB86DRAFT_725416 [Serendipita vermifera]|nr:hypothetical protein CPB86DRAFT_725416 [Serendipita vermifera]